MSGFDNTKVECPQCGSTPLRRIGEIVDELMLWEVAETGESIPHLEKQEARFRCDACGHETLVRRTY